MSTIGTQLANGHDSWRWVMLVGSAPFFLGLIALVVPESPQWLAMRANLNAIVSSGHQRKRSREFTELFRSPLLKLTLVAILLGTVRMIGDGALRIG
jgi:hypothetical protein